TVRDTLERQAQERALDRLRERQMAQSEALRGTLQAASVRRSMQWMGATSIAAGVGAATVLHSGIAGTVLTFLGLWLMLAGLGVRFGMRGGSSYEQIHLEREALRTKQALEREIRRREKLLAQFDAG